jgi:hypothetical protein
MPAAIPGYGGGALTGMHEYPAHNLKPAARSAYLGIRAGEFIEGAVRVCWVSREAKIQGWT